MISSQFIHRLRVLLFCLPGFLFSACNVERAPESESANQATPAPKTWTDIPVSKPEDRITIHYHRNDDNYAAANLYTWDGHDKSTPKSNLLKPLGHDEFGIVFQLDRANYGGSDKVGFITRQGEDWSRKDGGDKFWTPALGNEVWVIGNRDDVFAKPPDVSPRVEVAYADAPDKIVVRLMGPAPVSAKVVVLTEKGGEQPASSKQGASSLELEAAPGEPLDFANHRYSIRVEGFGEAVPLTARGLLDDRNLFFDGSAVLGATFTPQSTTFRVFAPNAQSMAVAIYDEPTGDKGRSATEMKRGAKGIWEVTLDGNLEGKFYTYSSGGPGLPSSRETVDPYAINAVANGARGRITALPPAASPGPAITSAADMVVYEMQVRDFTISPTSGVKKRGLYLGFTEPGTRLPGGAEIKTGLDHLSELGVTHVQIMPVQDFENDETSGNYNWGYVTTNFFSPEGMFATNPADDSRVKELHALVEALHSRGIGVIMDVVYNHTAGNAPFFSIAPDYYYRHTADGALSDGSKCGNEFRSEAPMTRKLIIDSLKFWVKEYGVDGFRFDLMALIDQETMREAESALRAINPHVVLYGEPWTAGPTPLREKTDKAGIRQVAPVGAFDDDYRDALHGQPEGNSPGWIQNGSKREALKKAMLVPDWFASPAQQVNYMTCHDNLVLWDKLKISMPGASDELLKETMKLGYLVLFTSQGVPFFQSGEEFARSKGGNNNSYDAPDSVNEVDWSLKQKNFDLFRYVRDLIALRKAHPMFRLRTREEVQARLKFCDMPNEKALMFTLDGAGVPGETWQRVCVVLNSDDKPADATLPGGAWSVAIDNQGASAERSLSGTVSVARKSGLVLYQR